MGPGGFPGGEETLRHTLVDTLGGSFFVALALSLDVCDCDFQTKQPWWVPSDGGISRDALAVAVKRGLSPGGC